MNELLLKKTRIQVMLNTLMLTKWGANLNTNCVSKNNYTFKLNDLLNNILFKILNMKLQS
jgi:hypothetical protein